MPAPRPPAVPASLPNGADFLLGGISHGSNGVASSRGRTAGASGNQDLETAQQSSGDSPAAPQQRRKRMLVIKSDTDEEVLTSCKPLLAFSASHQLWHGTVACAAF